MATSRLRAALLAGCLLAGPVLIAAPAEAAVPTTTITGVSGGEFRLLDLGTASTPPDSDTLTVTGTATGTSTVDLRCFQGLSSLTLKLGVTVTAGAWTWTGPIRPIAGETCRLVAVPGGTSPTDLSPFTGQRTLSVATSGSTAADGAAYGFTSRLPQRSGSVGLDSSGHCALDDAEVIDPVTSVEGGVAFGCAGAYSFSDAITLADSSTVNQRGGIRVDGKEALTPLALVGRNAGVAFPVPTRTSAYDPTTGNIVLTDVEPLTICGDGTYPADHATCASPTSAGVSLHRTLTQDHDGRVTTVHDGWSSTDGRAHALDLQTILTGGGQGSGVRVPWFDAAPVGHAVGQSFGPGPSQPATISVLSDPAAPISLANPLGEVTFSVPPSGGVFGDGGSVYVTFQRTIPAAGEADLTSTYAWGSARADVDAISAQAVAAVRPQLVLDPLPASLTTKVVTITGTVVAGENSSPTTVSALPGPTVPVGADHRFSITLPLRVGTASVTLATADDAGLSDTETRSIRVVDPLTVGSSRTSKTKYVRKPRKGRVKAYVLKLPLACAGSATPVGCATTLVLRRGTKVLVHKVLLVRAGGRTTVTLTLPTSLTPKIRALRPGHSLTLALSASDADPAGPPFATVKAVGVKR